MKITNQLYRNIFSKSIRYLFITTHLLIFLLCIFYSIIFDFSLLLLYRLGCSGAIKGRYCPL